MRTIGLLGGMSWESTLDWYRAANRLTRERLGGYHSAPILLDSLDFSEVEALQAIGDWEAAGALLATHAARLEAAGAELVALCTNTMHLVAPAIEAALTVPFVHLGDVTAAAARDLGATRVGLLGTAFTMEQPFYRDRLADGGIDTIVPAADDRALVHRIIYDELVQGVVRDESRDVYRDVMRRLVAAGAEAVVLGCTEIELLVGPADADVPVLPTTALHVRAVVELALEPVAEEGPGAVRD